MREILGQRERKEEMYLGSGMPSSCGKVGHIWLEKDKSQVVECALIEYGSIQVVRASGTSLS